MKWKQRGFLLILIIAVISTGILLYERINTERQAKTAEIILDYDEFVTFAKQLDMTPEAMFTKMAESQVSSVAIKEDSLYSLVEEGKPITYAIYKNLIKDIHWKDDFSGESLTYLENHTGDYDMVVSTYDDALYARLKAAIIARYDEDFYHFFEESDLKVMVLKGVREDLYYVEYGKINDVNSDGIKNPRTIVSSAVEDIGLGYDPEKIAAVKASGLEINLRPSNFYKYNSHIVKAYFDDVDRYGAKINEVIFNGNQILSYQKETGQYSPDLYKTLKARNIPVGLIESGVQRGFSEQDGIEYIAKDMDYEVVRIFPIIEYIQQRYDYLGYYEGPIEIENTMYRAITERNIRSVYFRPFKKTDFTYYDNLDEYITMFDQLADRLSAHHISLGKSSVMPYNGVSPILLILTGWGLLVLGLIILKWVFGLSDKWQVIILIIGMVGIIGANYAVPNMSLELFAFLAAIIFPTLAIMVMFEYVMDLLKLKGQIAFKKIILKASIALLGSLLLCLIGGLTVGAIMSKSNYLVEMSFYRGVKASLVLPIVIFIVVYFIKMGYKRNEALGQSPIEDIKRFLNEDFKIYYVLILGVVAVVGYVYIARSGHETGIEVLNGEIIFRNFLENVLIARPRTKEILIAFPALCGVFYLAARQYKIALFPFTLVAVLGFTSVVNTFCHARTPIYLSFFRELIAIGIGLIIGIVVMFILELIHRIYVSYSRRKKYE